MRLDMSYDDIVDDLKALAKADMPKTITATIRGTVICIAFCEYAKVFRSYELHRFHYPQFESRDLGTVKRKVKEYYDNLNTERVKWVSK
jgi:hypothetical protein